MKSLGISDELGNSLLAEPLLWKHYQGSLCRTLPCQLPIPARYHDDSGARGSLNALLRSALGIERLYVHQVEIIQALADRESRRPLVIAVPFGSGRSTALFLGVLPRVIEAGCNVLLVSPTESLARTQTDRWKGKLDAAHISWLLEVRYLAWSGRESVNCFDRGTVLSVSARTLSWLLCNRRRALAEFASHMEAVVCEDLDRLGGPLADHYRCLLGRLRVLVAEAGDPTATQWIGVVPEIANPDAYVAQLGLPIGGQSPRIINRDSSPSCQRVPSIWVPAAVNIERRQGDGPRLFVELIRRHYWWDSGAAMAAETASRGAELTELAATALLTGRTVGILSGEVVPTESERRGIQDAVRGRLMSSGVSTGEEVRRLFLAATLDDIARQMAAEGGPAGEALDVLIVAGLREAPAQLERTTRHVPSKDGKTVDVVLLVPRTPFYQHLLNSPESLGFALGTPAGGMPPTPGLTASLHAPAGSDVVARFHARLLLLEASGLGGVPWSEKDRRLDLLPVSLRQSYEALRATGDPVAGQVAETVDEALASLEVTTTEVARVVETGTGTVVRWIDSTRVAREFYPGGVFVHDDGGVLVRFRVDRIVTGSELGERSITADIEATRLQDVAVTRRIAEYSIEERPDPTLPPAVHHATLGQSAVVAIQVSERVIGRRTYQGLDLEQESQTEKYDPNAPGQPYLVRAPFLTRAWRFTPRTEDRKVLHSLAHLFQAGIARENGPQGGRYHVVPVGESLYCFDDEAQSDEVVRYLNHEGPLLRLHEFACDVLERCPCDSADGSGCPGCLGDWQCVEESHEMDKWETLRYLTQLLRRDNGVVKQKERVTEGNALLHHAQATVRVMKDKLRAELREPFAAAFWDRLTKEAYSREAHRPGLAGICDGRVKRVFLEAGMSEAEAQDVLSHEYFHNFQAEGNLHPSLRYYNRGDVEDTRNIPYQGKLFEEGSANWSSVVVSDFWGGRHRVLRNTLTGRHEYLEGYKVLSHLQTKFGVVRTLEFLRDGRIEGGLVDLARLYGDSGLSGILSDALKELVGKQGERKDARGTQADCSVMPAGEGEESTVVAEQDGELLCVAQPFLGRRAVETRVSHYLTRWAPKSLAELCSEERITGRVKLLLRLMFGQTLGELSVAEFLKLLAVLDSTNLLDKTFARYYEAAGRGAGLAACHQCKGAESERLVDACILHKGTGLLRALRFGLIRRLVTRPWLLASVFSGSLEDDTLEDDAAEDGTLKDDTTEDGTVEDDSHDEEAEIDASDAGDGNAGPEPLSGESRTDER
jgi:hypothetical protein